MNGKISGHLIDAVTGKIASSSKLSLTCYGVLGESFTEADQRGRFLFTSLPAGRYSLGVHDDRYAPLYRNVLVEESESTDELEIALTPAAFITGRILDEEGQPPQRCHVTFIKLGVRGERSGYISDSGDHDVTENGYFSSPQLHPGRYFLRFAGILRNRLASSSSHSPRGLTQERIFDFLYPNAQDIKEAAPFDLEIGQTMTDCEVRIPRPNWHTVRGKVIGALPDNGSNMCVMFTRDVGMIDDFGSGGPHIHADGTFEGHAQPGRYRFAVWEMEPSRQDGYTRMTRELASIEIVIAPQNLDGLEIQLGPPPSARQD